MITGTKTSSPEFRAALITGGTRGIGQACVYAFARAGYRVAFCYKNAGGSAGKIVAELQSEGHYVCAYRCDVTDSAAVEKLFAETKRTFGVIDTLVNNAGTAHKNLLTDETPTSVNEVIADNLISVINVCRIFIPAMVSEKFGRIVNLSSVFARIGASTETLYTAAKSGVEGFTRALAKELAPSGITANAVAPGFIDTDMNRNLSAPERIEFLKGVPVSRTGTVAEVAAAVLFLASAEAGYITGETLNVTGGL